MPSTHAATQAFGRARLEQIAGEAAHAVELLQRLGAASRGRARARPAETHNSRDRAADARRGSGDEDAPAFEHR